MSKIIYDKKVVGTKLTTFINIQVMINSPDKLDFKSSELITFYKMLKK